MTKYILKISNNIGLIDSRCMDINTTVFPQKKQTHIDNMMIINYDFIFLG